MVTRFFLNLLLLSGYTNFSGVAMYRLNYASDTVDGRNPAPVDR